MILIYYGKNGIIGINGIFGNKVRFKHDVYPTLLRRIPLVGYIRRKLNRMAKIVGGVPPFIGTRDNLTIYLLNGEYIVRSKSSLTGKRVKRDPAFAKTMKFAGWLKQASRIASGIYQQMPADERIYKQYRQLTGKAMSLLKEGFDATDVITMLEAVYLPQLMENTDNQHPSECRESDCRYAGNSNNECCYEYVEYNRKRARGNEGNAGECNCRCNCNNRFSRECVEHSRKYRIENVGECSHIYTGNCNNTFSHECIEYSRKYGTESVEECSHINAGNCNNAFIHECIEYCRKRTREYVYASEYIKSYYTWGDRP